MRELPGSRLGLDVPTCYLTTQSPGCSRRREHPKNMKKKGKKKRVRRFTWPSPLRTKLRLSLHAACCLLPAATHCPHVYKVLPGPAAPGSGGVCGAGISRPAMLCYLGRHLEVPLGSPARPDRSDRTACDHGIAPRRHVAWTPISPQVRSAFASTTEGAPCSRHVMFQNDVRWAVHPRGPRDRPCPFFFCSLLLRPDKAAR